MSDKKHTDFEDCSCTFCGEESDYPLDADGVCLDCLEEDEEE